MTYTVWMHDRQIGETAFEYEHDKRRRAGSFLPTEFGLRVLPSITAMAPALFDFGELCKQSGLDPDDPSDATASAALTAFSGTAQGQRVIAAAKQIAQLEVRDPGGRVVPWDSIAITDLEWLLEFTRAQADPVPNEILDNMPAHDPIKFMISLTLKAGVRQVSPWRRKLGMPN